MISKILSIDWAFWFFWIMATTLGWLSGSFILASLAFVASGFLVGVFQSLVLHSRIAHPWRWIGLTFAGWSLGYLVVFFGIPREFEILDGVVIGLTTGIAQWVILRHELRWTGWWIVFSVIAWTTGLSLLPGAMLTGTTAGALTGIALEILLRHPRPKVSNPDRLDLPEQDASHS